MVVSKPMRDELLERGVSPGSILLNPNGVDPQTYSPSIDGGEVRRRYGLAGKIVVGFIGTFERWHGADVLAHAIAILGAQQPNVRDRLRLLLIGDGPGVAEVRRILESAGLSAIVTFAGRTEQADGPQYLAACDILVAPHVPNRDGSRFFGSPTKLFEYMAMGKPVVASDLEQIGEVLTHEQSALLCPPGNAEALAASIERLVDDVALRDRLGGEARASVERSFTWEAHTRRILDAVERYRA